MVMVSIFYLPKDRDENALTHAFLVTFDVLSQKTRDRLLQLCGLEELTVLGKDPMVDLAPILDDGTQPDGTFASQEVLVAFENKVDSLHTESQLGGYYSQLRKMYPKMDLRLLIAGDENVQTKSEIEGIVSRAVPPGTKCYVVIWQDVGLATRKTCSELIVDSSTELDRFMLTEFRRLLEEMDMEPYSGLEARDLEGFGRSLAQLRLLENHLREHVPRILPELANYDKSRDDYGSLLRRRFGFAFCRASGATPGGKQTLVYLRLDDLDRCLDLGIASFDKQDLSKLERNLPVSRLVDEISRLGAFRLTYYHGDTVSISSPELQQKLSDGTIRTKELFEKSLEIFRRIPYDKLESEFGLRTVEFPRVMLQQIVQLRQLVQLFHRALVTRKAVKR